MTTHALTIERVLDWEAEPPIYLFSLANSSAGSDQFSIGCSILEPSNGSAMVGVPLLVAGTTTRPAASVAVSVGGVSGAATVEGTSWYCVLTPTVSGTSAISATATDASNATTATATASISVSAAATFPASVSPLFRLAGAFGAGFSDTGGTVPAAAPKGLVRRFNEVSPLTSNWQAINDASRPRRDASSLRIEAADPALDHILQHSGAATGINLNDSMFVASWVARDGQGGPPYGLIQGTSGPSAWGAFGIGDGLAAYYNSSYAVLSGMTAKRGARLTLGVLWTSTGLLAKLFTDGVAGAPVTITDTVSGGFSTNHTFNIGNSGLQQTNFYGSLIEATGVNGGSEAKLDALMAYADALPGPPAYPLNKPMLAIIGDSIAREAVSVNPWQGWVHTAQRNLRPTYDIEMCNLAITGGGVSNLAPLIAPFYNARRVKNVCVFAAGTNEFAAGNDAAFAIPRYWATCDAVRALGYTIVACTVLPRSGLFASGVTQSFYDAQMDLFNAEVRNNWRLHADSLADVTTIVGMGAHGDSNNPLYYLSLIHI